MLAPQGASSSGVGCGASSRFGDLDGAEMQPEKTIEIRDALSTIRARCDELDRQLQNAMT